MALLNCWSAYGVLNEEPKIMKLDDEGKCMAKSILVVQDHGMKTYIPVIAFNKKAHILCSLAHRGSAIFAKGTISSKTETTSEQGKTLIGILFKITDFTVLKKEPLKVEDVDFVNVVKYYDPDTYMAERIKENVEK